GVRIIAATNRNLEQMLKEGKFREDLYYRLKVIPIVCPPLRQRREDIEVLAGHFLRKARHDGKPKSISRAALSALEAYNWPGNIRQLEWAIERAALLGEGDEIMPEDLPPEIREGNPVLFESAVPSPGGADAVEPVIAEGSWEEHEKVKILEALQRTNGNITRAAQLLGMTFRTLQYRLEKFGIKRA
ncbi:MAG: helix-turn-helix domain-containing protein, partial [Terriglobia bacterium]